MPADPNDPSINTPSPEHQGNAHAIDWQDIDCVFLDMDGTLLDLNYDNHVWNDLVPQAYAEQLQIPLSVAKQRLLEHMAEIRGTIEFYSFEYWTAYTGVDLVATHELATDLVAYRPGALAFLRWLKTSHCQSVIATNAHYHSIAVKDSYAGISGEVDAVVSSHHYQAPKEADAFWQALFKEYAVEPSRCIFVDDNEPVLDAAAHNGIGHLYAIATPDSMKPARTGLRYRSFDDFAEICPAIA